MEQPVYSTLPLNFHPQQKQFNFEEDELIFNSKFDSGNLQKVERIEKFKYKLYISSDCFGIQQEYSYRTWFFFSVLFSGNEENKLEFTIFNYSNQSNLYNDGYKIVYRIEEINYNIDEDYIENEEFKWRRVNSDIRIKR